MDNNNKKEIKVITGSSDIIRHGLISTKYDLTVQMYNDELYIYVLNTFIDKNADEIPYLKWLKVDMKELEKIIEMKKSHQDSIQIWLERTDGGILKIGIFVQ